MPTNFSPKQPSEEFTIMFDFTNVLLSETIQEVLSIVATDLSSLEDVSEEILDETKQFNNTTQVYTKVRGGETDHNYNITCKIKDTQDNEYELDGILPVKELPDDAVPPLWEYNFRTTFPQFANTNPEKYTTDSISIWYNIGKKMLNVERFGNLYDIGLMLFVAHNVLVAYNNQLATGLGDENAQGILPISNSSVGDVSVSYDLSQVMIENAEEYNSTLYGRKLYNIIELVGSGGVVV